MSTIGIIQIRDEISRNNGECCCICFRSASERRLVEPQFLNTLIGKLAHVAAFKNQLKVCYICEALARSAARFVKAVEMAAKVSEFLSEISKAQWLDIARHLRAPTKPDRSKKFNEKCPPRRALRLERELRSCPRYDLYLTNTLVVAGGNSTPHPNSASASATASATTPAPARLQSPPRTDMLVVMQHEEIPTVLPVLQPMPVMSQIVLPALPQMPAIRSRLPKLSIDADNKHMRVLNKDTNEFILHPMVTGVDGNIYVPSLQLQILDNGILKSIGYTQMQQRLPSTYTQPQNQPNLNPTNLNSVNLNSVNLISTVSNKRQMTENSITEKSKENSDYYNFLMSQMKQKSEAQNVNKAVVIKMDDLNLVVNVKEVDENASKKKRKQSDLEQTLSEVEHILDKNAQGACEIRYELIDDEDDINVSGNHVSSGNQVSVSGNHGAKSEVGGNRASASGTRVFAGGNRDSASGNRGLAGGNHVSEGGKSVGGVSGSKEPVLRTDRTVDWEDKIPMDVISFMDATDPNPEERIMQPPPMGFISDVRSVPDVPENTNNEIECIECIDLC